MTRMGNGSVPTATERDSARREEPPRLFDSRSDHKVAREPKTKKAGTMSNDVRSRRSEKAHKRVQGVKSDRQNRILAELKKNPGKYKDLTIIILSRALYHIAYCTPRTIAKDLRKLEQLGLISIPI